MMKRITFFFFLVLVPKGVVGLHVCMCLVTQSCLTLCKPIDSSPPGSSIHGDTPGKNTEVGCHALLQGIFPTQGLNPGLPHCRHILYHLSHQESPQVFIELVNFNLFSISGWSIDLNYCDVEQFALEMN